MTSTKSLHNKLNPASHNDISKGLLEVLAKGSQEPLHWLLSTTGNFKLIPFAKNFFSIDQITALIQKI